MRVHRGVPVFGLHRLLIALLVAFGAAWIGCGENQETPGEVLAAASWAPDLPLRFQSTQSAVFLERYAFNCMGCHSYQGRAARVPGTPAPALETAAAKVLQVHPDAKEARAYLREVLTDPKVHWKKLHEQFVQMGLQSRLDLSDADRGVLIDALMAHAP